MTSPPWAWTCSRWAQADRSPCTCKKRDREKAGHAAGAAIIQIDLILWYHLAFVCFFLLWKWFAVQRWVCTAFICIRSLSLDNAIYKFFCNKQYKTLGNCFILLYTVYGSWRYAYILNNTSMVPIYEQLIDQVKKGIISGSLTENEVLPSVRALSGELRISAWQ